MARNRLGMRSHMLFARSLGLPILWDLLEIHALHVRGLLRSPLILISSKELTLGNWVPISRLLSDAGLYIK